MWARDLVETGGALLALGCRRDARRILGYLIATQQADGHWFQNQWLGGKPFWEGMQLDEAAFPVLLASALAADDGLGHIDVRDMILRALRFIASNGPASAQDRWEEEAGINTFTLAVVIAALVEGSRFLEPRGAECALMIADAWNGQIEAATRASGTVLATELGVTGYYMRSAPDDVLEYAGAKHRAVRVKNRNPGVELPADEQVAIDCLQLVRFGLRRADDPLMLDSVAAIDATLKVDTPNGPVWRRYAGDGYGETADGAPFNGFKDVGLPQMRKLDSTASEALTSVKVKIGDDYFLFALAKGEQDAARNLDLMKTRAWFDFPLLLNDNRIAKLVFQKSAEGEAMLEKAFDAWK